MSFRAEIIEINGELGIILPPEFVQEHGLKPDGTIEVEKKNGAFFLRLPSADGGNP